MINIQLTVRKMEHTLINDFLGAEFVIGNIEIDGL